MRPIILGFLSLLATSRAIDPLDQHQHSSPPDLYSEDSSSKQTRRSAGPCPGNAPQNRQEWCGFDIHTDYTTDTPDTGVTREFWLELDQAYLAPDGRSRWVLAINGSIPGPTLEVNWGDTVVVHLHNNLGDSVQNGTSMHFHGIRQLYSNPMDGVVSVTQCPLAPGHTMTYRWRATQYGTTWYHSHIGLQTWEGVFGGIIIHGPASANYDEDKGVIMLNDWDIDTVDELWDRAQLTGAPKLDNALIHGTNVFGADGDTSQTGHRFNMSMTPGKSYRLRLGNAACDTHFKFSIDHHRLTVIATDLVPVQPYTTDVIDIAIGQRYDVIVEANQTTANAFWLRAVPQTACSQNSNVDNIRGIVYYDHADTTHLPNTTAHNSTNSCTDEDASRLVPIVSQPLTLSPAEPFYNETLPATVTTAAHAVFRWQLNGTSMHLNWTNPTLHQLHTTLPSNASTPLFSPASANAAIPVPHPDTWVLVVIESALNAPHPVHLHGHDFYLLAQGPGSYQPARGDIHRAAGTAPKRDTALLPASGHLALAFRTDNPGAWLLHCHIGWHLEMGFALQFVEREAEIRTLLAGDWRDGARVLEENCAAWARWCAGCEVMEDGSGV